MHRHVDVVDVAGDLAEIVIEARGVEAAAEDVIAELQRIVVRIEAVDVDLLGEGDGVLYGLRVGHVGG